MILGRVVRLEPDKEQFNKFFQFTGTNRLVWNMCKARYDSVYKEEGKYLNESDLRKYLQDLKHNDPAYAWLNDIPEAITKRSIKDLLKAYQKFYKDRKKNGFAPKNPDKYKPKFNTQTGVMFYES